MIVMAVHHQDIRARSLLVGAECGRSNMCKVGQGDRVGSGAAEVNMAKQGMKDEDEGSTPLKSRLVAR